jgi:hypothetical protein
VIEITCGRVGAQAKAWGQRVTRFDRVGRDFGSPRCRDAAGRTFGQFDDEPAAVFIELHGQQIDLVWL